MSESNNNRSFFKNEFTVARRDWIDRAVQGVKSRLSSAGDADVVPAEPQRPLLYVVDSKTGP